MRPTFDTVVRDMALRTHPLGFDVCSNAPSNLTQLNEQWGNHKRFVVSPEFCDCTIFDAPRTNHEFRAWHDWCHWALQADFDWAGEYRVFQLQCSQLIEQYGAEQSAPWRLLLEAEIMGQLAYCEEHGAFPADQRAFDEAYMKGHSNA